MLLRKMLSLIGVESTQLPDHVQETKGTRFY